MVSEDGEGVGCEGARGYVEDGGKHLAGNLVHIRNHQEETLGSGVGCCQGTSLEGTVDSANVSRRKVMEEAMRINATRVILAHNHPRGVAVPSSEDLFMTREIGKLFEKVGIELVDHIIVADDDYVSMAASGFDIK